MCETKLRQWIQQLQHVSCEWTCYKVKGTDIMKRWEKLSWQSTVAELVHHLSYTTLKWRHIRLSLAALKTAVSQHQTNTAAYRVWKYTVQTTHETANNGKMGGSLAYIVTSATPSSSSLTEAQLFHSNERLGPERYMLVKRLWGFLSQLPTAHSITFWLQHLNSGLPWGWITCSMWESAIPNSNTYYHAYITLDWSPCEKSQTIYSNIL